MKNILFLLFACSLGTIATAQHTFTNETNRALEKVIRDYPFRFQNIKDKLIRKTGETAEFSSKITIPEALGCAVVERRLPTQQQVSWEALMHSSSDFATAGNVYKSLYTQIKNTIIKLDNEKPIILNGNYETPSKNQPSTAVLFDLLPRTETTQHLKINLQLVNAGNQWKIILSVYEGDKNKPHPSDTVSSNDY